MSDGCYSLKVFGVFLSSVCGRNKETGCRGAVKLYGLLDSISFKMKPNTGANFFSHINYKLAENVIKLKKNNNNYFNKIYNPKKEE